MGELITLDVALKVLIVESANDVAVMIAEGVAGSPGGVHPAHERDGSAPRHEADQFCQRQRPARRAPGDNRPRPGKLARAIIIAFPKHADLFTTVQVQVDKQILRTHNGLLVSFPGADGMKTGFICESGFNVVASATRDGHKLVAVVLGGGRC